MGGGGGGGPTTTTVNQSNIPEWLRPQVEQVLGGATKELFRTKEIPGVDGAPSTFEVVGTKPFTPYSANVKDYVADFSPLQQQVQANAANLQMPGQFNQATGYANAAGQGGLDSAGRAYGYGNAGFQSGQMGQQLGMQGGDYYGRMGAQAGLQGQQSGLLGQQLGMQGGQYYGNMGAQYGQQGAGYGAQAADVGQMGLRAEQYGRNVSGQAEDYARQAAGMGDLYGRMATSPSTYQAYMSPYQEAVTNVQLEGLQRQADIAAQGRKAQAARAGAYGGSRQAIENAEANRALASQMDAVRAQGLQQAYQQAQANIGQRAQLGLQGLQGANQGLGTALQGGQLGLSGIGTALQGLQGGMQGSGLGIQGAQAGLQGVNAQLAGTAQGMQGAQAAMQGAGVGLSGVDRQLAGTAQGMQGAQVGLQGVSGAQAGYGLANQAASNLANIGTQQLAGQTGILGLQNQIGAQQQGQQQQYINQAIQNYAQAQEAPMQALNQYNALLRGYALPGTTQTQYQAQPTLANQALGFGTAAVGAAQLGNVFGVGKKAGGTVRSGIADLGLYNAMNRG
jgi:hypothetical protein